MEDSITPLKRLDEMLNKAVANTKPKRQTPRRLPNLAYRSREYLTPDEMSDLIAAARPGRDRTLLTTSYVHGLRLAEIIALRWDQVDLDNSLMHIIRVKRGTPAIHPIPAGELRMLSALYRDPARGEFVFRSRQSPQISRSSVQRIFREAGKTCTGTGLKHVQVHAHPHIARHSCGYRLAASGVDTRAIQAYLGHRSIQCTVRYTELSPDRFDGIWKE